MSDVINKNCNLQPCMEYHANFQEGCRYIFASRLLCIALEKIANKEQRLWHNERPSFVTKYWSGLLPGNLLE